MSKLLSYNIGTITDNVKTNVKEAMNKLLEEKLVDSVLASDGNFKTDTSNMVVIPCTTEDGSWNGEFEFIVKKDQYTFDIIQKEDGTFEVRDSNIIAGSGAMGGEVTDGRVLVTKDTFTENDSGAENEEQKGIYTVTGDASVIFADELSGEYSLYVKDGAVATVSIFYDMTLTNEKLKRSAIDIEPGGTLNLWIAKDATVTVDSGFGDTGANTVEGQQSEGGKGGFAGIHCWTNGEKSSVLNISGEGTLYCFGGDAGAGGVPSGTYDNTGGGRWPDGAGAGIGRKWWKWRKTVCYKEERIKKLELFKIHFQIWF